jgi:hypothetical protein
MCSTRYPCQISRTLKFSRRISEKIQKYSSVGIETRCGLDGPGIESRGDEIFGTRPDRPWGPPSLLCNGYRVFPGGKVAGHPPHLAPRLKKEYIYTSTPPLGLRGLL